MNKELEEKIKIWKNKLQKLEEELKVIMEKRGEAMAMGDLRENAAFQMLDEDASTWQVKISEVKKIIAMQEQELKKLLKGEL